MNRIPSITEPAAYRIRIVGRVGTGWSDFMTDLDQSVNQEKDGTVTAITGVVPDQAALFGMLGRIRDLRLALISVEYLPDFKKA
jgi:hypothetical protein